MPGAGVDGNRVFGRGAVDAKGPLAAAAVAAIRARDAGRASGARIEIIGAVGEEGPSHGARHLVQGSSPDALIIGEPGGSDSVVLGYKGSMRATFTFELPSGHTAGAIRPCRTLPLTRGSVSKTCAHHSAWAMAVSTV